MIGWECGTFGRKERWKHGFNGGNLREVEHLKDRDLDGRIILKLIVSK